MPVDERGRLRLPSLDRDREAARVARAIYRGRRERAYRDRETVSAAELLVSDRDLWEASRTSTDHEGWHARYGRLCGPLSDETGEGDTQGHAEMILISGASQTVLASRETPCPEFPVLPPNLAQWCVFLADRFAYALGEDHELTNMLRRISFAVRHDDRAAEVLAPVDTLKLAAVAQNLIDDHREGLWL